MSAGAAFCCDERRIAALRAGGSGLNGIDFLEVGDLPGPGGEQRLLRVAFALPPSPALQALLTPGAVAVEGGDRVRGIRVEQAWLAQGELRLAVSARGDFSAYTLRLRDRDGAPLAGMDPQLSAVDFSFKAGCPADGDCRPACACPPHAEAAPELDYLSKDFASFRRLMLDRMALLLPGWREDSTADLGIALVELLAYVGDHLSYQQDAVANEAYLGTARRRVSVRRHARLVDYPMHDGRNARAWVHLEVAPPAGGPDALTLPTGTPLLTRLPGTPAVLAPATAELDRALAAGPEVFETLHDAVLRAAHNRLPLYAWGERECCLPRGATRATLDGHFPDLAPGDVLVLEEVLGPRTGAAADADPARRHAVRLTAAGAFVPGPDGRPTAARRTDPVFLRATVAASGLMLARGTGPGAAARPLAPGEVLEVLPPWAGAAASSRRRRWNVVDADGHAGTVTAFRTNLRFAPPAVTEVEWDPADALPFPLCLSATTDAEHGERYLGGVSVARGNVVLADHGRSVRDEPLGAPAPPDPRLAPVGTDGCGCGGDEARPAPPSRFRPRLREGPVTQAARAPLPPGAPSGGEPRFFDPAAPAAAAMHPEMASVLPVARVDADGGGAPWRPRRDLLASDPFARDLVVEVEDDGRAALRFGDDLLGERPSDEVPLRATYRVGNGARGNVGADALAHLVSASPAVAARVRAARNPLPAEGGTDPEPVEHVRQVAPTAFRDPRRAVTADDYARVAELHPQVQRARATLRWTGSWRTVFLTVDRAGGREVDAAFEAGLRRHLERYRLAGHDLEVDGPRWVALEVEVFACVAPGYFRGDVERALRAALGSRALPGGGQGLFHPDGLSFGESVFLSRVYAAAQAVPGVARAEVRRFRRRAEPKSEALQSGELKMGRLEVARLDDDPNHPDRGVLRLALEGGR